MNRQAYAALKEAERAYLIWNEWHTRLEGGQTVWVCPFVAATTDFDGALTMQKTKDRGLGSGSGVCGRRDR